MSRSAGMPGGSNTSEYSSTSFDQRKGSEAVQKGSEAVHSSNPSAPAHVLASMAATWLVGCSNINQDSQPLRKSRSSYVILHNSTLATGAVGNACNLTLSSKPTHFTAMVHAYQSITGFVACNQSIPNTTSWFSSASTRHSTKQCKALPRSAHTTKGTKHVCDAET